MRTAARRGKHVHALLVPTSPYRREATGRRQKGAIKIENIHPLMSAEEKRQAMEDIARVLKGNRDA